MKRIAVLTMCSVLVLFPAACSAAPGSASTATFTDPFAYCAAVGTIDKPDMRYTGMPVPDTVINSFKQAAGLQSSTEPMDMLRKTTIWRCMGGKVYACNFGANLPCDSKANTNQTPSPEMNDYCKANPNAEGIPMAVTGHDTVYSWHCVSQLAQVLSEGATVDPAGYIEQIWYAIQPAP